MKRKIYLAGIKNYQGGGDSLSAQAFPEGYK